MSRLLTYKDNKSDVTIDISKAPDVYKDDMARMAEIISSLSEQNRELRKRNRQLKDAVTELSIKIYYAS